MTCNVLLLFVLKWLSGRNPLSSNNATFSYRAVVFKCHTGFDHENRPMCNSEDADEYLDREMHEHWEQVHEAGI